MTLNNPAQTQYRALVVEVLEVVEVVKEDEVEPTQPTIGTTQYGLRRGRCAGANTLALVDDTETNLVVRRGKRNKN